jgi:hypothetical protein
MMTAATAEPPLSAPPEPAAVPVATRPCAEERRIADERCDVAARARDRADAASDALRTARRRYDNHESGAAAAMEIADPRVVQAAKESAQAAFRSAAASAASPGARDAAARDWLNSVNRINREAREATRSVHRERAAASEIGATLERLALEADAARITAANADVACLAARSVAADCDEISASDQLSSLITPVAGTPGRIHVDEDETLGIALEAGGEPLIFGLLKGDRTAMDAVVTALAGDDVEGRRHWNVLVGRLIDAITADAIEASVLVLPDQHGFWGMFTQTERRAVAHALASLGYRFDGVGGWIDARYPSKRDLSLAMGYAGLDPMRVRQWPNESAIENLFAEARVASDEYLATRAGDMTLAEMVAMLGRRANTLAEVWNAWGRIRPLLLSETGGS